MMPSAARRCTRASRTVPFVSKAIGVPLAKLAAKVMAGHKLSEFNLVDKPLDGVAVVTLLFDVFLVVVVSIYMLLDMPRLEASIDRRFPPHGGLPLTQRIERALLAQWPGAVRAEILEGKWAPPESDGSGRDRENARKALPVPFASLTLGTLLDR